MAELKTKKTRKNPRKFLEAIKDDQKRKDSLELLKIFSSFRSNEDNPIIAMKAYIPIPMPCPIPVMTP